MFCIYKATTPTKTLCQMPIDANQRGLHFALPNNSCFQGTLILTDHLNFTRRKSSKDRNRTALAEHDVQKALAGKKGGKNKYGYRPAWGKAQPSLMLLLAESVIWCFLRGNLSLQALCFFFYQVPWPICFLSLIYYIVVLYIHYYLVYWFVLFIFHCMVGLFFVCVANKKTQIKNKNVSNRRCEEVQIVPSRLLS